MEKGGFFPNRESGLIMSKDGISVSDKEAKESSSNEAVDLGLKLQSGKLLQLPWEMMMMMVPHDHNLHRPFPPYAIGYGDVDAYGPTSNNRRPNKASNNIYDVLGSSSCSSSDYGSSSGAAAASAVSNGGAVGVSSVQPFDISFTTTNSTVHTAFKSPEGMAASLDFPFTSAQWKELQRQAMIYKHMKASLPVPPDLLIPFTGSPSVPVGGGGALNRMFSGRADVEPGRCRRTDGKKWRCSRDVAQDQKYCERHMHRGRPRSRKPVERPNKKTRHAQLPLPSLALSSNPNQTTCFLDKPCEKPATFWPLNSVSNSYKEPPRHSDWIMNEQLIPLAPSDQQWHDLSFSDAANSFVINHNYNEEPLSLNLYANFNATGNQQRSGSGFPLFANSEIVPLEKSPEDIPRGFIDAWSTGHNDNCRAETPVSSNGQLSLSSLSLSMGVNNIRNESDENHEYAASKSNLSNRLVPASWAASTPGGPLAEVLRASKSTTAEAAMVAEGSSNPSSPVTGYGSSNCSPTVTAVSSPSGVLQRTLASFSDSSCCSSPTLVTSGAKTDDIGLVWLKGN